MKCGREVRALEAPRDAAVAVLALVVELEEVLGGDDLALHAGDLGHLGDPPHAVAHAADLHDQVDGALDLLAHRLGRQLEAGHRHHVLEPRQRVARGVGVDRAHRAVVAGVHRLQHVDRFLAADLAEDDAVGPHAQRVLDEVAHGDLALALDVGGAGLEAHHVRLLQLQLGRVLDRHRALAVVDHPAHGVEQRGLARAGAAGDEDVEPRAAGDLQHRRHVGGDVALPRHHVERDLLLGELADRDGRPVDGRAAG